MSENRLMFWQRMARHYTTVMGRSAPLYREVCSRIRPHLNRDMNVLELACGTGQLSFPLSPYVRLWEATDFSSNMIAEAKRQVASSRLHFSVQDATDLPYAPETFDAVVISNALHILPEPDKVMAEIRRVLKPGGYFLYVVPGADHLWELKQILYDRPYPNEEKETPYEGFVYQAIVPVEETITLPCQADIHALFQMTPYYWKTPKEGAARLAALDGLKVQAAFRIHVFRRD